MEAKKGKKLRWMLLAIFIGYTCIYLDKTTIGLSLVTIAADLGLSPQEKGFILSMFFLGYTLLQIPGGYLVNKIGARRVLILSVFLVGVFLMFFGIGFSLIYLMFIRFATGAFAHSGYPTSVSTFIAQELPVEKKASAQSAMIASSGVAGVVGPLLIAPLLLKIGWHTTYYVIGGLVMVVAVVMAFVIPKTYGQPPKNQQQKTLSFKEVLQDRNVWVMIFAAFFINAALYGLNGWMATYLVDAHGLSLNQTAWMSAVVGFFMMLGPLLASWLVNRWFKGKEKQMVFIMAVLGGMFALLICQVSQFFVSMLCLTLAVTFSSLAFASLMSIPVKVFPVSQVSTKYATINALGVSGGFFSPMIIGKLVQVADGDFIYAFLFIALAFVIAGVTSLLIVLKGTAPVETN